MEEIISSYGPNSSLKSIVEIESPTKPTAATQPEEPAAGKTEPEAMMEGEDSNSEFVVDSAEMEESEESDSEAENEEQDLVEETFTIQVENGELKKLKFPAEEMDTQESQGIECLENTMDDEDDENDKDFNPCHVSVCHQSRNVFNHRLL